MWAFAEGNTIFWRRGYKDSSSGWDFTGINLSWREGSERNECDIYREVDSDTWVIDPKDIDLDIVKKVLEIWVDNLEVIK